MPCKIVLIGFSSLWGRKNVSPWGNMDLYPHIPMRKKIDRIPLDMGIEFDIPMNTVPMNTYGDEYRGGRITQPSY